MYAISSGAVRYFSDQETLERYWINSGLLVSGFGSLIIAAGLVSLVIAALIMGMVYFIKFSYQTCNGLYRFLISNPFQQLPKIIAEKPSLPKWRSQKKNKKLFYEELATLYIIHSYSFFQIHDLFWDDVSKLNFVRTSFHSDYTNRASHQNAV